MAFGAQRLGEAIAVARAEDGHESPARGVRRSGRRRITRGEHRQLRVQLLARTGVLGEQDAGAHRPALAEERLQCDTDLL